jgi:cytochrome b involved in lipid metabolism
MSEGETKFYTAEEVATHHTESDLWVILDNKIYDLTEFVTRHPGGRSVLVRAAGTDITDRFLEVESHVKVSVGIQKMLIGMLVGELKQ